MSNVQRRDNLFTQDAAVKEELRRVREVLTQYTQPGAIEEVFIGDGAVTGDKIAASSVTADKIVAGTITALQIAAGAITANEIAANTITAGQIAADTITGDEIAANTITAAEIASNAITTDELAANTITAGDIAAGTITATQIAANTITSNEIAANAITADEIAAGAVTAAKIQAITIESGNVVVGGTVSGAIQAGAITSGKIAADAIDAMTITGATLRTSSGSTRVEITSAGIKALNAGVTTFNVDATTGKVITLSGIGGYNRINNSLFRAGLLSTQGWNWSGWSAVNAVSTNQRYGVGSVGEFVANGIADGTAAFLHNYTSYVGGTGLTAGQNLCVVEEGKTYTASAWVRFDPANVRTSPQARIRIMGYTDTPGETFVASADGQGVNTNISSTAWTRVSVTFTIPTGVNVKRARIAIYPDRTGSILSSGDKYYITGAQFEEGEFPTEFSPKIDDIPPDTISGIELGPITTTSASGGTITVSGVAAGTIAAGTIAADRLVANSITATQIAAGTITATQIAAGTITADKFLAKFSNGNLLYDSSFESLTLPGWDCIPLFVSDLTTDISVANIGIQSAKVTLTSTSSIGIQSAPVASPYVVRVIGNTPYSFSIYVKPQTTGNYRSCMLFMDAVGDTITQVNGTSISCPSGSWTRVTVSGTSPSNTQFISVWCESTSSYSAGAYANFDNAQLEQGDVISAWNNRIHDFTPNEIRVDALDIPNIKKNKLSNASFENDISRDWTGSLLSSSGAKLSTDFAFSGTKSLKMISNGSGNMTLRSREDFVQVEPSTQYTLSAYLRPGANTRTAWLTKVEYNSSGVQVVAETTGGSASEVSSTWTRFTYTFTTNSATKYLRLGVEWQAAVVSNEVHYVDAIQLEKGAEATTFSTSAINIEAGKIIGTAIELAMPTTIGGRSTSSSSSDPTEDAETRIIKFQHPSITTDLGWVGAYHGGAGNNSVVELYNEVNGSVANTDIVARGINNTFVQQAKLRTYGYSNSSGTIQASGVLAEAQGTTGNKQVTIIDDQDRSDFLRLGDTIGAAPAFRKIDFGTVVCTFTSSAISDNVTVNHSCGVTPSAIVYGVTGAAGSGTMITPVTTGSPGSTSFTVQCKSNVSGSFSTTVHWMAIG